MDKTTFVPGTDHPIKKRFDLNKIGDRLIYPPSRLGSWLCVHDIVRREIKKSNLIIGLILIIVFFNCLLTYGLMWNPYSPYFERPEFSSVDPVILERYGIISIWLNFGVLLGSTIWMIIRYRRKGKFFLPAPFVSILTLALIFHFQKYYPDSINEYTEDGYRYRVEKWYLNGQNKYKRWKSADLADRYDNHEKIIWTLDSTSVH